MLGARLAAEVRQHLLGAHELCAREAATRPDPHQEAMRAAQVQFQRKLLERQAEQPRPHGDAPEGSP